MQNQINYSKSNAIDALNKLVIEWINAKDSRNVAMLARGAGVSEACIRRIVNNKTMPTTANLYKVVSFIRGGNTHHEIMESISDDLQKHLKFELTYLQFEEYDNYVSMTDKEHLLPDYTHQAIFERSSIGNGLSLAEVKDMFGSYGTQAVQNLITNNLVKNENEIVVAVAELKNHSWSTELYKSFLSETIKNFYKTDSQVNYLFNINDGVSVTGYSKVMDILEAANHKILQVIRENSGNIPLSVGGFMDTLTYKNLFSNEEDNK